MRKASRKSFARFYSLSSLYCFYIQLNLHTWDLPNWENPIHGTNFPERPKSLYFALYFDSIIGKFATWHLGRYFLDTLHKMKLPTWDADSLHGTVCLSIIAYLIKLNSLHGTRSKKCPQFPPALQNPSVSETKICSHCQPNVISFCFLSEKMFYVVVS